MPRKGQFLTTLVRPWVVVHVITDWISVIASGNILWEAAAAAAAAAAFHKGL